MTFNPATTDKTTSPASAFAVTPHDTNELESVTRSIYVGTPGNVKLTTATGDTVTYVNVVGRLAVNALIIFSTGTTASDIIGEY